MQLNKMVALLLLISVNAFALTEIPAGKIELEGKILTEGTKTFILVNPGTLSQTKLYLLGESSIFKDQLGSNARIVVKLTSKIVSSVGEAKFIKLVRFLHPAEDLKSYSEEKDFQ